MTPGLARLLENPACIADIPDQDIRGILRELTDHEATVSALLSALVARLHRRSEAVSNGRVEARAEDRLLMPKEAAARLGVTSQWLYRHHKDLPFAKKLSPKCLRFSEAGLRKWMTAKGTGQS